MDWGVHGDEHGIHAITVFKMGYLRSKYLFLFTHSREHEHKNMDSYTKARVCCFNSCRHLKLGFVVSIAAVNAPCKKVIIGWL